MPSVVEPLLNATFGYDTHPPESDHPLAPTKVSEVVTTSAAAAAREVPPEPPADVCACAPRHHNADLLPKLSGRETVVVLRDDYSFRVSRRPSAVESLALVRRKCLPAEGGGGGSGPVPVGTGTSEKKKALEPHVSERTSPHGR